MVGITRIFVVLAAIGALVPAAAVAAENRPGSYGANPAYCYTYDGYPFKARITVNGPSMSVAFPHTYIFDPDGTMNPSPAQQIAYRAELQMKVGDRWYMAPAATSYAWINGKWVNTPYGPWMYSPAYGGGFAGHDFAAGSSYFEIVRRGQYRIVYVMHWFETWFWPYPGHAAALAMHGPSGYSGYADEYCYWPDIRIP